MSAPAVMTQLRPCGASVRALRDRSVEPQSVEAGVIEADRLASIGALVAGVTHEINNPLTSVLPNLMFAMSELERGVRDCVARLGRTGDGRDWRCHRWRGARPRHRARSAYIVTP